MNDATLKLVFTRTALFTLGWLSFNCSAAVFYGGQTKGLPGANVELTINVEAGTVLESIDIVPDLDAVAGILNFVSFTPTAALTDGGSGLCAPEPPDDPKGCAFFYFPDKTFAAESLLATVRFVIDPAAPVGLVPFDAGVFVSADPLQIPDGAGFEVLAVPEPASAALLCLGLLGIAGAMRHRKGSEKS